MVSMKHACMALALCGVMGFQSVAQAQPGGGGGFLGNLIGPIVDAAVEEALVEVEAEIDALAAANAALQAEVDALEAQLAAQAAANAAANAALQAQITAQAQAIADLEATVDALGDQVQIDCGSLGPNIQNCNGVCTNTQSSTSNCGACGVTCGPGQTCVNGVCGCPGAGGQYCRQADIAVGNTCQPGGNLNENSTCHIDGNGVSVGGGRDNTQDNFGNYGAGCIAGTCQGGQCVNIIARQSECNAGENCVAATGICVP